MNNKRTYSITRTRNTTKPSISSPEPQFYMCKTCLNVIILMGKNPKQQLECCGQKIQHLYPKQENENQSDHILEYSIVGGYDHNAIIVTLPKYKERENHDIQWVYLRTFTGGQIKYINSKRKTSVIFALAEEDAYVYCDEDPCLQCTFRCKRGFDIYIYCSEHGLWKKEIANMRSTW